MLCVHIHANATLSGTSTCFLGVYFSLIGNLVVEMENRSRFDESYILLFCKIVFSSMRRS